MKLSHINDEGRARMVDVTQKSETSRTATAEGTVKVSPDTMKVIRDGGIAKGDVLSVAQVAGIMAAKRTADIIPMCHPLNLTSVDISFTLTGAEIHITATVKCKGSTGVEMEALTAVSTAALTIYDMCKAVQRDIEISDIRLLHKNGGKSGEYIRNACVRAVCVSEQKGTKKHPVPLIHLKEEHGIVGDAHAGAWHRQVSLLAEESVDTMRHDVPNLKPGDFAENILTHGIDLKGLPIGTVLEIGDVLLEVTQIGKECHADCEIRRLSGRCVMPTDGIFAKVLRGGDIRPDDIIKIRGSYETD